MNKDINEIQELRLEDLKPFSLSTQTYGGDRLEQLMSSIERLGLQSPIIVRPTDDGKYEIICGHNRAKAMGELGHDVISAVVYEDLSDDEAIELFYDSNLNQQSFSEWNYSQKIEAVRYINKTIKENSQQGNRNDRRTGLEDQAGEAIEEGTCVQSRHKSSRNARRETTRDRMSRRLGIATATLSKYRSIIKLPDDLVEVLARLLDEKRITFESAYWISRLTPHNAKILVECIEESPDKKVDLVKLKELCPRSKKAEEGIDPVLTKVTLSRVLVPILDKQPVKYRN